MMYPVYRVPTFLAVALCCSGLHAANLLTATPGTVAIACNTITGPGPAATVVIKPVATLTSGTITVSVIALGPGVAVTPPSSTTLNAANQSTGLTYSIKATAGCAGATSGSVPIRFYASGTADVAVTATTTVIATATPLAASPIALTCIRSAATPASYTAGPSQTTSVVSAAAGGTPFAVDTSSIPSWLSVTPTTGGVANPTGVSLTVAALAPCGNYASGTTNSASIHLRNLPAPDGLIPVTLQILGPSPLTSTPQVPSLAYTKGSGSPASVEVALSAAGTTAQSFAVDASSLPAWLSVNALKGTTPGTLRFTTTSVADTSSSGSYTASVHIQVSGYADLTLPFRLTVSDPPPTLTVEEGTTRNLSWTIGQPQPIPYITLASSGSAIPYTIATGGALAPMVSAAFQKGFVYSYDTPIPVTFSPSALATAQGGSTLSGTVTITWGAAASATVITFQIAVQSAAATLTGANPLNLPTATAGQTFTIALSGTGFVSGDDVTQKTVVGIVFGGSLVADANLTVSIVNSSNIILVITVPKDADSLLPFSPTGAGGTVVVGVCNPMGLSCNAPTGTAKLVIGASPVIQAVSSASSFQQVTAPAVPTVAPYDMVSLFGINFCTGATGCGSGILYGSPDPATWRYAASLSPDAPGSNQRVLTVTFQTHTTPPVAIASAPLLFATSSQINLVVPSVISVYIGKSVDIVVSFGAPSAMVASAPFPVNVAASDPGVFTMDPGGRGDAAVLSLNWTLIGQGNEAGMRQNPADSDTIQIFMTGLGMPDGQADDATTGTGLWPADCVSTASYLYALNRQTSASSTTLDGAVIASSLLKAGRMAPCLQAATSVPTIAIGGQPAVVTYAGWVPDSPAGLYQMNVRLPGTDSGPFTSATGDSVASPLTAPVELPVMVTARGRTSQPGVTLWVAPRLKVAGLSGSALLGVAGVAWTKTGSTVLASEGKPPYTFAVTGGSLPTGMTLDPTTGALSGIPATSSAGTYPLTITATDSAAQPLTGTTTFTLTVAAH